MIDIIGICRTPFSPILGPLSKLSSIDLGIKCLNKCLNNYFVPRELVDTLILSQAFSHGSGPLPVKNIINRSNLINCNNYYNISNMCTSGLKSVELGYDLLTLGKSNIMSIVGTESCSNIPFTLKNVRCEGYKFGNNTLFDPLLDDYLNINYDFNSVNNLYKITNETVNNYIETKFNDLSSSYSNGTIQNELIGVPLPPTSTKIYSNKEWINIITNNLSQDVIFKGFKKDKNYPKTSKFSDGSSCLIMCNKEFARKHNLQTIAKIKSIHSNSHNSNGLQMNENRVDLNKIALNNKSDFDTTSEELIDRNIKSILNSIKYFKESDGTGEQPNVKYQNSIDIYEILDQNVYIPLIISKLGNIDTSRINLQGGCTTLGHPPGATGIRQIINLITSLKSLNLKFGLAIGSNLLGDTISILIENV